MKLEWVLFLTILLAGLWPILRRGRTGVRGLPAFGVVLCVLALAGAIGGSVHLRRLGVAEAAFSKTIPREGRPGGYVTSDQCRACHPDQFHSWHASYHRTMTQFARPDTVLAAFDGADLDVSGQKYRLERRGSEFWAEASDPAAGPAAAVPSNPRAALAFQKRLGIVTGSHSMQVFWVPTRFGNMQVAFPLAYLLADRRWVPFEQTFLRDPKLPPAPEVWNRNCINCHAVGGQPRTDLATATVDSRVGELGISCEGCHGPGEAHVRANQDPLRRYRLHHTGEADPTIVNPRRVSSRASSQICGQCHGIKWIARDAEWNQEGATYRPGEDLEQTTPMIRPRLGAMQPVLRERLQRNPKYLEERYWNDGIVRVSGRDYSAMLESACFQRGSLSCLSCHSMHHSDPAQQLAPDRAGNAACLQCHQRFSGKHLEEHTHHAADSTGSLCYNCHMPYTTYGLLKAIRSHYIDSPNLKTSRATGRPVACNLCHLDRTLAWTARAMAAWYGTPAADLSADEQEISAAVLWALRGDAGQRALIAWSMGWKTARETSGVSWLAPFLGQLFADPYSAVRYIARRSLRQLPGFDTIDFDFTRPGSENAALTRQILERPVGLPARAPEREGASVLIGPDGRLQREIFDRLLRQRDDHSMDLQE